MDITAIFCFALKCSACTAFKNNIYTTSVYESVLKHFKSRGVKCIEFTAPSPTEGFVEGVSPYNFLSNTSYFPTLILLPTDLLLKGNNVTVQDLKNEAVIYMGIIKPEIERSFTLDRSSKYSLFKLTDYNLFLTNYMAIQYNIRTPNLPKKNVKIIKMYNGK